MEEPKNAQPPERERAPWEKPELVELPLRSTEGGTGGLTEEVGTETTYAPS
jgi:hypothetical protein